MISVILFGLLVNVSIIGISIFSRKSFSGAVYASTGVPIGSAIVSAHGSEGSGYAVTDSLGHYSITEGLKTGTYTVTVMAEGYLNAEVEDVSVTVGMETSGIDFYLTRSGGISGRITDHDSGLPLQDIMITAYSTGGGTYGWYAITDANGNYHMATNLATETYNVSAFMAEGYFTKTIGGIEVTAGFEVTGIDLELERSGVISGRVTTPAPDSVPLGNASVYASSGTGYFGFAETDATGYYRISSGLGTGTYTVTAVYLSMNIGYASDVSVTAGSETSNVDIVISVSPPPPSGIIEGKVTDTDGQPISYALVSADGPSGSGEDYTDENGDYVISQGLGTGTYDVHASATGYVDEHIINVEVTVNQVTSNINFQLSKIPAEQSGIISGTVSGEANPIPEFPYPFAALMIATLVTVVLLKLFRARPKIRRAQLPIEGSIN